MNLTKHLSLWLFDKSVWVGVVIVGAVVAYIEIGRRLEVNVPIPFLILLVIVVLVASIGGKRPGIAGGVIASGFIFYSMLVHFGPSTLTGGPVQVSLGISLTMVVSYFLGRMRDQNQVLIKELQAAHADLEKRVVERTAELSAANERLREEMTEREQAEAALKTNEIYFRSLIENALDIVTVLNGDGTIRYESPSIKRALGYDPEELIGRNVFEYVHPDDIERVSQNYRLWHEAGGQSKVIEFRFRHKDGSWRILEAIGNNLLGDPNVGGAVINSRDVTRRREIEKQIQRQEQLALVGQLAAGIAHDFNNVMGVILLYTQILRMSPNLTAKEKTQLDTIFNEGTRAAELTAQILDFGRQSVLDRETINVASFLESFVKLVKQTVGNHIEVGLSFKEDDYFITADSSRIQQALMNLVLNSRDAMPDGGRIEIELAKVESQPEGEWAIADMAVNRWAKVVVSDNGSGITAEGQDHLFEPFYTTKEPGKGTGLGLAQVYGIVKQHHGFIGVESEPGKGTTFTISLPLVEGEGESAERERIPDSVMVGHGEIILVVEDNHATRLALMAALESLNYIVKGVSNGVEALTLLRRHKDEIALVMSDIEMPEMGGVALLEAMEEKGFLMPVILLTGDSNFEETESVRANGRAATFMKPIPLEMLGRVVAEMISGR